MDSVPVLKDNLSRASKEKIRIFQAASISCNLKGQEETDMDALKEAGACGFTDDGIPTSKRRILLPRNGKGGKS